MKKILISLSALAFLMATGAAFAGEQKLPKEGPQISITFPDDWTVEPNDDDDGITAVSKDEAIEIDVWAVDKEELKDDPKATLDAMGQDIGDLVEEYLVDLKTQKPVETTHNGIQIYSVDGAAKDKEDGTPVNFSMTIMTPDNKNIYVMLYWGSDEAEKSHGPELQAVIGSLKKL